MPDSRSQPVQAAQIRPQQNMPAAGLQHAIDLSELCIHIHHMFHHTEGCDRIEFGVPERDRLSVIANQLRAVRPQLFAILL